MSKSYESTSVVRDLAYTMLLLEIPTKFAIKKRVRGVPGTPFYLECQYHVVARLLVRQFPETYNGKDA